MFKCIQCQCILYNSFVPALSILHLIMIMISWRRCDGNNKLHNQINSSPPGASHLPPLPVVLLLYLVKTKQQHSNLKSFTILWFITFCFTTRTSRCIVFLWFLAGHLLSILLKYFFFVFSHPPDSIIIWDASFSVCLFFNPGFYFKCVPFWVF